MQVEQLSGRPYDSSHALTEEQVNPIPSDISDILHFFHLLQFPEPYQSSSFEMVSPIGELGRRTLIKTMLALPRDDAIRVFTQSPSLAEIRKTAASHRSLLRVYEGPMERSDDPTYDLARLFMDNTKNAIGARNRLRIVKQEFGKFLQANTENETAQVLSIAAGSNKGIVEVAADQERKGENLHVRLADISRTALEDGEALAKQLGVQAKLEFKRTHFLKFDRYLEEGYNPKFVEIVGLLDYVSDTDAVKLLSKVKDQLQEGGSVLFSNIVPNDEQRFIHEIVGWLPMVYRTSTELEELTQEAGFAANKIRMINEPIGVYNLIVAKK